MVLLDTSFVVDALVSTQTHHAGCSRFLETLAEAGSTIVFSRLLELELAEAAFKIGLRELHPGGWRKARHDGRSRRRGRARMHAVTSAWEATLLALDWARIEIEEVIPTLPELMGRFGLASYDAVHAATALAVGVHEIVTLDTGFAALPPQLASLLVDSTRVRRCRQTRGAP